jgi:hypothetical protein
LQLQSLGQDYAIQKDLLDGLHKKTGQDIWVASYSALQENETGKSHSYCVWTQGTDPLLPRAEEVYFLVVQGEREGQVVARASWDRVQQVVGHLLEPQGIYPVRYRVKGFPTARLSLKERTKGLLPVRSLEHGPEARFSSPGSGLYGRICTGEKPAFLFRNSPEPNRPILPTGEETVPTRGKCHAENPVCVTLITPDLPTTLHIPQPNSFVLAAGESLAAARAKGYTVDLSSVVIELPNLPASRQVPQTYRAVRTARQGLSPIGGKGNSENHEIPKFPAT